MIKPILLTNVKKYYKELPHQKQAVEYLGTLLLKTPARQKLSLNTIYDWILLSDVKLEWLQRQISQRTLQKFAALYRGGIVRAPSEQIKHYSQLNNYRNRYNSCNSSSHAMFVDYVLRTILGKEGLSDDDEYVRRVYSNKYGTYGKNNSVSWDVQLGVVKSYGIKAKYVSGQKSELIRAITEKNLVAPANFRHKGSMYKSYGGHVVLIADYKPDKGFLIYDPYGYRMPNYSRQKEGQGIYWMSNKEFNARHQGIWTKYLGKV